MKFLKANYINRWVTITHHDRLDLPTNNTNINNTNTSNTNKKVREGEPSFPDLSDEESNIISMDYNKTSLKAPATLPDEYISNLDKYVISRFNKERTFYGINFNQGLYYNAFS